MPTLAVPLRDLLKRLPRPLDPAEVSRAETLLDDAAQEVADTLEDHGVDPADWLAEPRQARRATRVVRAMVAQAVLIGDALNTTSIATGTGPYSDSVTWDARIAPLTLWGEAELTADMLHYLGVHTNGPRGRFPTVPTWPGGGLPWRR